MDSPDPTLDLLELDVAARLRPVCAEMTDEEFRQLVHDIARVKLKYGPPTSTTEKVQGASRAVFTSGEVPPTGKKKT